MSDLDNQTLYKLGQIEGKLDSLIELVGKHVAADEEKHGTLDKRITGLETSKNRVIGAAAVITVAFNAAWGFIKGS